MAVGSLRHQHPKGIFDMFSLRRVCRSVSNHPFFLAVLLFLICLHRYFPFLFSLLVSASPVLICTAIVLGTLLIHGQPNNNDVKYHEEVSNAGATVRTGAKEYHPYPDNREGIFSKDRFAEVRNDIIEKGMRASGMLGSGTRVNSNVTDEIDWEYCNIELSKVGETHEEKSKRDYDFATFEKANVQTCVDRDYDNTIKFNQDVGMQVKSRSSLGEQKADDTGDHEYDTNIQESSDYESDGAEKSSFDALVADVIPTAQETHPLLDSEDPSHPDASHDASLNFEFQSLDSNQSSEDSGEDENDNDGGNVDVNENLKGKDGGNVLANAWIEMEKNQHLESLITKSNDDRDDGEEEVEDDESIEDVDEEEEDDDDDEDQDNQTLEKDARTNQVTMWTEEDEKNLRLVGNSEFERDLRLENLLARRRAKRNFSMISERNLIDLDRPVLPIPVTPISTTRVNPFETPVNTKQQQDNIPPIPGSAPSVRVAKNNPFDSPCTSPKGVQNLKEDQILKEEPSEMNFNNSVFYENGSSSSGYNSKGNIFKPESVEMSRKDAVFRRYESFSTGYSIIGESSGQGFTETDRRDAVLRRHETFNTRSAFHNSVDSPQKPVNFRMRPFFVPEYVVGDQDERHSSSSHDSESTISSSESDHTESSSTLAKDEDVGPSKDTTAEGDHAYSHSKDTSSDSSDMVDCQDDDPGEEFVASLDGNADSEEYGDEIYQISGTADDQRQHNASSSTSVTSEDDHGSDEKGEDEDEVVSESGFSLKATSSSTIEPPVYDASPGTEKTTPFSSMDSQV